jgi:predicted Zn-dependent protease
MKDFFMSKRDARVGKFTLVVIGGWFSLAIVAVCGCEPASQADSRQVPGQGPGKRPQQLALSPEQELELGKREYLKILSEARAHVLAADDPHTRQCRYVAAKLVRAAGIEPLQREINLRLRSYRFEWEVNVVKDPQVNAFCLPGGKIIVFTGILGIARSDDQVAVVLGHEIAHALAHHVSERVARDDQGRVSYLRSKSYDRQQESEADHIGLFLMTFAGFNPQEAVRFWQRMEQHTEAGGKLPEFLSDHPSGARRIHDLQTWVPKALEGKKAFDEGRIAPAGKR